jgi:hypothetical protein
VPKFVPADADTKADMEPDFVEALRSLGYVDE